MPVISGQVLENRYRIVKLLGQGGFGAVYRAWDTRLDIPVAIKENLDTSETAQRQFGREAKMLAMLSHPNLARVSDFFFIPEQGQYLIMNYVEGESLEKKVQQQTSLPEEQVIGWVIQVCDALEYLHGQNPAIIHRDIKPANIIIQPNGQAILVDFGIAKIYDAQLSTTLGAKAITPGYSPPEQYGGGKTDARSDIYALGATMYYLLTGNIPNESVQLVANGERLRPPRYYNRTISIEIENVLICCTELETSRRFQQISELTRILKDIQKKSSTTTTHIHSTTGATEMTNPYLGFERPKPTTTGFPNINLGILLTGFGIGGFIGLIPLFVSWILEENPPPLLEIITDTDYLPVIGLILILGAGAGAYGRVVGNWVKTNIDIPNILCPVVGYILLAYIMKVSWTISKDEQINLVILGFALVLSIPFLIKMVSGSIKFLSNMRFG